MKKITLIALTALVVAGTASAKLRWNPEGSWTNDQGVTTLPLGDDNKSVVNKLGKLENGNWRSDIRFAQHAVFTDDEPYLVVQITTDGCAWNLNDYKFEFMLQRKLSDGLNEEGAVKWGNATSSTDEKYPSFDGTKLKIVDEYEADLYTLLGSRVNDGESDLYTDDVIVIDLNKVRATDDEKTQGLLFSAGDVDFPNYNSFYDIVTADENGQGGVQQRSWIGFVCIAKPETVTVDQPTFTVHYTGTVADSSDALTVCENYANGEGGLEVRDDDDPGEGGVGSVKNDSLNIYLHNGKAVYADGAELMVYTADGKLVKSGYNTVELESGLYIVKAVKNGMSKTVKALVK